MKLYILLAYLIFMVPKTGKTIEDFRWEKRLLIMNFENPVLDSLLENSKEKIVDRKLLLVEFSNNEFIKTSGEDEIDSAGFLQVLSKTSSKKEWMLIGLDGGEKASGTFEEFSIEKVFSLIDQMPMRISEKKGLGRF